MEVSESMLRSFKGRRMTNEQIAAATGLDEQTVRQRLSEVYSRQAAHLVRSPVDPNEYEIMLRASAIRMTWSPDEEARRRAAMNGWTPPDVSNEAVVALAGLPSQRCWSSRLR